MKIDADLRLALKVAEKAQRDLCSNSWSKSKSRRKVLAEFLKSGKPAAAKLAKAIREHKALTGKIKKVEATLDSMGVSHYHYTINDDDAFRNAGGTIPHEHTPWKSEQVIAELLAAKPNDRKKVLQKYGINWE